MRVHQRTSKVTASAFCMAGDGQSARRDGWLATLVTLSALLAGCAMRPNSPTPPPLPPPNTQSDFFKPPADDPSVRLDPQDVYPNGQKFPISFFSLAADCDIAKAKDNGFTMMGPYQSGAANTIYEPLAGNLKFAYQQAWDNNKEDLCKLQRVLACSCGGTVDNDPCSQLLDWPKNCYGHKLPDPNLEGCCTGKFKLDDINIPVKDALNDPNVSWWNIFPEEPQPSCTTESDYLRLAVSQFRKADQGISHRQIWVYNPSDRTQGDLEKIAKCGGTCNPDPSDPDPKPMDLIVRAAYAADIAEPPVWIRFAAKQAVDAAEDLSKASTPPRVPVIVLELYKDPPSFYDDNRSTITQWTRHDSYLSLVSGIKGILIWAGARRAVNDNSFGFYFDGYGSVARDLTGRFALGRVFLFGESRSDLTATVVDGPTQAPPLTQGKGGVPECANDKDSPDYLKPYDSVNFANIQYGTERYLIAVNSTSEQVTVKFKGLPLASIHTVQLFDAISTKRPNCQPPDIIKDGQITCSIHPLDVVGWRLSERLTVVPDCVGEIQADAVDSLKEAGLVVGAIGTRKGGPRVAEPTVVCQWPEAGKDAPVGSAVDLLMSRQAPYIGIRDQCGANLAGSLTSTQASPLP